MAHRCWAVDEIVRAIVVNLVRDEKRASAVALASCSKSLEDLERFGEVFPFSHPWLNVSLLRFGESKARIESWQFFKRAPLEAEWLRFQQRYASKVQYCYLKYPGSHTVSCLSLTAFHLLQLYSSHGSLLPNLTSLQWSSDETYLPFVSLFISSSLTSIILNFPLKASPMLPPILKRLSQLSPDIREIEIDDYDDFDGNYHDPSMEEASSQLLMHCNHHLRKFKVRSYISASALRHVIRLPSLEEFWLIVDSFQLPDPLPFLVFPSLRDLDVDCDGDLTWLKLLPAIEDPVLTTISVRCPELDVERFMKLFEKTMIRCGIHESLQEFTLASLENFRITPQIIAHHLSFKNLTSLLLISECSDICRTSDLTDGDIDLLTKAMPCLEVLELGSPPCRVPSQITFKSLYTISRRCTQLNHLEIHFNPAQFVADLGTKFESWDVALGLSDLKTPSSDLCLITTIFVGNIPLPEHSSASSILALGLLGVFPRLDSIEYGDEDWGDVERLLQVFRVMGRKGYVYRT